MLRFREPDTPRPFRLPGQLGGVPLIPVLGVASAVVMMTRTGLLAAALSAGLVVVGLAVRAVTRSSR